MDALSDQLLQKTEKIKDFGGLPGLNINSAGAQRSALIEIAGNDSLAAGLLAAESGRYDLMVPTIVYTGSEYGDWSLVLDNARALADHIRDNLGIDTPGEPVVLGSPGWFHAVSGRFMTELFDTYGFSGMCISCHMYCHAVRVPLAEEIGAATVISGERLEHDGRLKINQLGITLDAYAELLERFGIELEHPLLNRSSGSEVKKIISAVRGISIGDHSQTRCVLEANYRDAMGEIVCREERLEAYLHDFLVPVTTRILESIKSMEGRPDYEKIAGEIISER